MDKIKLDKVNKGNNFIPEINEISESKEKINKSCLFIIDLLSGLAFQE